MFVLAFSMKYFCPLGRSLTAGNLPVQHAETDHSVGNCVSGPHGLLACIVGIGGAVNRAFALVKVNAPLERDFVAASGNVCIRNSVVDVEEWTAGFSGCVYGPNDSR